MKITDLDNKVLEELGLDQMPDEEKEKMLKRLDEVLMNRFMVNILTSLPEEKQKELGEKAKDLKDGDEEKFFEEAINLHPEAKSVLEKSAQEIIEEYKKGQEFDSPDKPAPDSPPAPNPKPPVPDHASPDAKLPTPNASTPNSQPQTPDDYYQAG